MTTKNSNQLLLYFFIRKEIYGKY